MTDWNREVHRPIIKKWLIAKVDAALPEEFDRGDFDAAVTAIAPNMLSSILFPDEWDELVEEIWDEW
jgi:hypothetical protein